MRRRQGFTLIELTLAMMLMLFVTGAAVQFLRRQSNFVTGVRTRMDALQNAQFAGNQIERELREAGAGVVDVQPMLVQIDSEAITFNANMVSVDSGDVRAVYQLMDANPNGVRVMLQTESRDLPNAPVGRSYPDTTYYAASGVLSGAETISYWLRRDTSTTLPNRYALFRRVNGLAPTLVARGIVKDTRDTVPIITYYTADTLDRLIAVPRNKLPMFHTKLHGSPADTGASAFTDGIRAVRLHFLAAARDPRTGKDGLRTVETLVRLMNSGLLQHTSCGQPPYPPSAVIGTSSQAGESPKSVAVKWSKSSDDGGGEKDIERYAIYRRLSSALTFGDPIGSIPAASKATYSFIDTQVVGGETYVYGISAQDCTPMLSGMATAPIAVTVNNQ